MSGRALHGRVRLIPAGTHRSRRLNCTNRQLRRISPAPNSCAPVSQRGTDPREPGNRIAPVRLHRISAERAGFVSHGNRPAAGLSGRGGGRPERQGRQGRQPDSAAGAAAGQRGRGGGRPARQGQRPDSAAGAPPSAGRRHPDFCHNNRLMTIRNTAMPNEDHWYSVDEVASHIGVAVDMPPEGTP